MRSILSKALLLVIPAAIALGAPGEARAQVVVSVNIAPPAAYIATVTPEYYEGRPVYWYNDNWYYRDRHNHWVYYRHEPAYLRERRGHWVHERERDHRREPARYRYRR